MPILAVKGTRLAISAHFVSRAHSQEACAFAPEPPPQLANAILDAGSPRALYLPLIFRRVGTASFLGTAFRARGPASVPPAAITEVAA